MLTVLAPRGSYISNTGKVPRNIDEAGMQQSNMGPI